MCGVKARYEQALVVQTFALQAQGNHILVVSIVQLVVYINDTVTKLKIHFGTMTSPASSNYFETSSVLVFTVHMRNITNNENDAQIYQRKWSSNMCLNSLWKFIRVVYRIAMVHVTVRYVRLCSGR